MQKRNLPWIKPQEKGWQRGLSLHSWVELGRGNENHEIFEIETPMYVKGDFLVPQEFYVVFYIALQEFFFFFIFLHGGPIANFLVSRLPTVSHQIDIDLSIIHCWIEPQ